MNRPDVPKSAEPIDLAAEPDFAIGLISVAPPLREVRCGSRRETIEPRVMQVLVALARADGAVVSRDALIERCWGGRIVGDDAINRCIAKIRSLAELSGRPAFEIVTVPRVGYRLQPLGGTVERETPNVSTLEPHFAFPLVVALVAAVAITGFFAVRSGMHKNADSGAAFTRVAVLPFEALGHREDMRVFGDAVAEQVTAVLNDNQVQTVSRADASLLRHGDRDRAATRFGAEFILDGTIGQADSGLRVTVHLDRASTHATLWTAVFDQAAGSASALQSQVAARVADEIKTVQSALKPGTGDIDDEALAAYLKAAEHQRLPVDKSSLTQVSDLLKTVIRRAPKFTPAYADLAVTSAMLVPFAAPQDAPGLQSRAREWAGRALALDPKNGDAYWALASFLPFGRWAQEEALYRRGLAGDPNHDVLNHSLADLLENTGRVAESLSFRKRALELDPLSPTKTSGMAWALAGSGRCVEALEIVERANRLWPTYPQVWQYRLRTLANCGRSADVLAVLGAPQKAPVPIEADAIAAWRAYIGALKSGTPSARTIVRRAVLTARASDHLSATTAMDMLVAAGDVDAAFDLAARSGSGEPDFSLSILFRTEAAGLRADSRFWALAAHTGLTDFWKASGKWPDFCLQPGASCALKAKSR